LSRWATPRGDGIISGSKVILRKKNLADARDDYTWHSDPELAHLDAAPVPDFTFKEYLADYTFELRYLSPSRRQFAIDTRDGKHIGNCVYYDVNEKKGEAELGIMIGDRDCWDKGYGTDAVTTLVNHIFRQTNLKRIHLKTLDSNHRAQRCFQKCGFTPCGHRNRDGFRFMLMELERQHWEKQPPETQ